MKINHEDYKDGDLINGQLSELERLLPFGYRATPGSGVGIGTGDGNELGASLVKIDVYLGVTEVNRNYDLVTFKVSRPGERSE